MSSNAPPDCSRCARLCMSRRNVVNGFGPMTEGGTLIVAQNPGQKEERRGRPLVGWSGERLITLAEEGWLNLDACRLENIARCRPPRKQKGGDFEPTWEEIDNCREYLNAVLSRMRPARVITLGKLPLQWFLGKRASIAVLHGQHIAHTMGDGDDEFSFDLIPMYHPAAAAGNRNPRLASVMMDDWRRLRHVETDESPGRYELVTGREIHEVLEAARTRGIHYFAFDFETTDPRWRRTFQARRAVPIGYSVSIEPGRAYYTTDSIEFIRDFLEDDSMVVYAHNAKFEYIVAYTQGIIISNLHDTKLMAYLLRKPSTHLKDLTWSEFGITQTRFGDVDWKDIQAVTQYGAADSDYALRLALRFITELEEAGLWVLYDEIERELVPIVSSMEMWGISIDDVPLEALRKDLVIRVREVQDTLFEQYPYPINWNSSAQKAQALFGLPGGITVRPGARHDRRVTYTEHPKSTRRVGLDGKPIQYRVTHKQDVAFILPGLGLPVKGLTNTGNPSTDLAVLRTLGDWVNEYQPGAADLLENLIERNAIATCLSQHVTRLPLLLQEDGRVHGAFNQAGAYEEASATSGEAPETGRFSSSGPNWQNVTSHGDDSRPYIVEWARRIRRGIIAADGHVLIKADFSKQEPRIAAFLSQDPKFIHDVTDGDFYKTFASIAYEKPYDEVAREERQVGKRMGMAWLNQAGPFGIRTSAYWMTDDEAREKVILPANKWYSILFKWFQTTKQTMREFGYVRTYFERIVDYPAAFSGDHVGLAAADRACIPAKIQGTGADIMKITLLRLHRAFADLDLSARLLMTVHDEVVIETPTREIDEVMSLCMGMSEGIIDFPLPVEISIGRSWSGPNPITEPGDQELIWEG